MSVTNFDRVAAPYQMLEYLAFGRTLEAARFEYLSALEACREVLIVGEGDGRFLARLLQIVPEARVRVIDSSRQMLRRAASRLTTPERDRVAFESADVRTAHIPASTYDVVVTLFVLDCFSPAEVERLVHRLARSLRAGGLWLFADFVMPARGWRRWRAALWIRALYIFFGWQTGLSVRRVPPSQRILRSAGLEPRSAATFQHGMLAAALYVRPDVERTQDRGLIS